MNAEKTNEAGQNLPSTKIEKLDLAVIGNGRSAAEYSGKISLRIPRSLHKALAEAAKEEGVSLNQYALYKLSK